MRMLTTLTHRMIGSATLDADSYEEVDCDRSSSLQAVAIVVVSSAAAAIGVGVKDLGGLIGMSLTLGLGWIIWVLLTLFIGTRLLPDNQTAANFGEVLRTTGFSATPGLLRVFGVVPAIGTFIFWAATIWMLVTFIVAIRQALDFTSTARAVAVATLGWAIHAILLSGFVLVAI